jgi:hypothetical protein
MRPRVREIGGRIVVAIMCVCAVPPSALAQQAAPALPEVSIGTPTVNAAESAPEPTLSAEDNAIIDNALAVDPARFTHFPAKPLRLPAMANSKALDLKRTDRPDGSGTVIVKKPLSPEWDANVGADLGLAANTPSVYDPRNPLGVTRNDRSSGAAWASVGVPNFASVDARVDPNNEQGRVGTTFKHSLPVGGKFAVTLQSRYSVTESLGQPQAAPSDIPLRLAPPSDPAAPVARVWGNENFAKLAILPTGTTLGAGLTSTSTDPVTHNTLSAEQKIYGPLGVTTAVTDFGRASESKSVSARLKLSW